MASHSEKSVWLLKSKRQMDEEGRMVKIDNRFLTRSQPCRVILRRRGWGKGLGEGGWGWGIKIGN